MKETTIFQSGNSQAMRIPKEMRFDSDKVLIEKIGPVMVVLDASDPWSGLRLAQIMLAGSFMQEGRSVNDMTVRNELEKSFKK